jgi:predicted DNA-binding transcriptional regulator YafY
MMARTTGGDKRSSWATFQRRLGVVRRLVRGPAEPDTLIAAVQADLGTEGYPPDARAALRHDLAALRQEFGCVISFHAGHYTLEHPGRLALLDLPDDELDALAFLEALVTESSLPNAPQLTALLTRVRALLPDTRQQQLAHIEEQPQVDVPAIGYTLPDSTLATLKRALGKQEITFAYQSPHQPDGRVVQHRVAPYDLLYRDGHTYLDAYCYACDLDGLSRRYVLYRLNRIVPGSLTVLPQRLPPGAPKRPTYTVRYWLAPVVARQRDISLWFTDGQVQFQDDGSAVVTAQTSDLWQARQVLLRYREHCRVLAPPELVTMIRESLGRMVQVYLTDLPAHEAERPPYD